MLMLVDQLYTENDIDLFGLEVDISVDEVWFALFSIAKDKTPSSDGFPISFYQKH